MGYYTSIAIDSNDGVHISYFDNTNDDLKYIALDASSNVYGYSISPDLPAGLRFNTSSGEISGTPTELSTNTTYTITARNSGGTNTTTITIEILDQLPTLSYSPENLTLTKGQSSTDLPLNATLSGSGTITSWAISPTLPSGLSFGTSNGTIWGTPTSMMTLKTYTIWGNNSGGSANATVNITVTDAAPNIAYNPDWFVLTNNTAMSPTATPTNSGGAVPSGTLDFSTNVGQYASIAIDSDGFKHISYLDATTHALKYATDKSGVWNMTSVDTSHTTGYHGSIAIDSNGAVHISYYSSSNGGDLKYATCSSACTTASNWNKVSVDTSNNVGYYTSIAIDSNDAVHISHFDDTNKYPKYATCSSGCTTASNWNNVQVETSGAGGYFTSIAIDSNDAVHMSYFRWTNSEFKYATCSSGCTMTSNWNTVSFDSVGSLGTGHNPSMAIDSNDGVHVSYFDATNNDLKYATCSSGCTTASNWNKVSVDTTGDVGYHSSIGIDSNDGLHISYFDETDDDLKYATCSSGCTTASSWNNETLDSSTTLTGEYTSIAIDANDVIHISYFDDTNNDLKYATCSSGCTTASNWNKLSVDTSGIVGPYTSIAIDSNDAVHISYDDATNGDL
ncbi:MAG: putative Ig domain-containing protein, partial [Poseidonia sp.]